MWNYFGILLFIANVCYGRLPEIIPRTNLRCGDVSIFKQTGIVSDGDQVGTECTYRFRARNKLVCQMRVDFDTTLAPPTLPSTTNNLMAATCVDDILEINGLQLCGLNRDQHIYIPFNRSLGVDSTLIRIRTAPRLAGSGLAGSVLPRPTWNIQVTQLDCPLGTALRGARTDDAPPAVEARNDEPESRTFFATDSMWLAPVGCTQYFPESSGSVESFNFNGATGVYPGNLRYAICFRRTGIVNRLQLTFNTFQMGSEPMDMTLTDEACYSSIQTSGRSEDFLQIPFAMITETLERANLFCGNKLATRTVTSTAPGPLVLYFNSDGLYKDGIERGFQFTYTLF